MTVIGRCIRVLFPMLLAGVVFCIIVAPVAGADEAQAAEEFYNRISGNPNFEKFPNGEQFCWHAASGIHTFVEMYEATGDRAWLDQGVRYYDFLVDRLAEGPDGYKGFIGPYIYDNNYWCDVHVGDAILWRGILEFSALVLADSGLVDKYGGKAREYASLASKHCIEKWDSRGTWREDGPAGTYVSFTKYLAPGDLSEWRFGSEVKGSNQSLPFNKNNDMGQVAMLLHRITGEEFYRDRAEKIFFRMKRQFQYFDNHYVWNYWEPFGPWDIDKEKNLPRHWVGVHPYRNYQAGEVEQIRDAYHNGIVFDKSDIEHIIATNLTVMWNGDLKSPDFENSNITFVPKRKVPEGTHFTMTAGTLWAGLLDFDRTVRELYTLSFKDSEEKSRSQVIFENVTNKNAPGFSRKYADDSVEVPALEFSECPYLNMAVLMPSVLERGGETLVACKAWAGTGTLETSLYSADGSRRICVLDRRELEGGGDGLAGIVIFPWDGTNPDNGKRLSGIYRVRWTFKDSFRECPVTVR